MRDGEVGMPVKMSRYIVFYVTNALGVVDRSLSNLILLFLNHSNLNTHTHTHTHTQNAPQGRCCNYFAAP